MRKYLLCVVILVSLFFSCSTPSDQPTDQPKNNLYFCGGQSNANYLWYQTIKQEIQERDPSAIVLWNYHPGHAIDQWINNGIAQANFYSDIQVISDSLSSDFVFSGIYWFQGEADGYNPNCEDYYEQSFLSLIDLYESQSDTEQLDVTIFIVDSTDDMTSIRQIQEQLIEDYEWIDGIDSRGYERRDQWHLTDTAMIQLVEDYFNPDE